MKDSWPNGCKAVNRVKNRLLWSGSMNADTLRPFSPAHKHLFGVKDEKSLGKEMEEDEEKRADRRGESEKVVGCVGSQSKAPVFDLNRPRYVKRTVG